MFNSLNKFGAFCLGIGMTLIILILGFHIWANQNTLGNCTFTDLEGTDFLYESCQGIIIFVKEHGKFLDYTKIVMYGGK